MFIGHYGVAFGAKKAAPRISLGTLFLAAQFLDLLWPTFLLLGRERVAVNPPGSTIPLSFTYYPWTHSLLMACVWGIIVGGIYWLVRRDTRGFVILALLVVSHWVLDLFVHDPDLLLSPWGTTHVGWGLWNSPILELVIELALFAAGVILYYRATSAKDAIGRHGAWVLAVLLLLAHLSNYFGPPPPDAAMLGWFGQIMWVFVILAYWVDRHRVAAGTEAVARDGNI